MEKTNQPTSSNATPNNQPKQLVELARLEIRSRELLRDLALVKAETYRLNREIQMLGIEIPWSSQGKAQKGQLPRLQFDGAVLSGR